MAKKYKWKVDRSTITLAEYEDELPTFCEEWGWVDKDAIMSAIQYVVKRKLGAYIGWEDIISCGNVGITKNRFRVTLYCHDAIVKYWKLNEGERIAIMSFDIVDAIQEYENMTAWIQDFKRVDSEIR